MLGLKIRRDKGRLGGGLVGGGYINQNPTTVEPGNILPPDSLSTGAGFTLSVAHGWHGQMQCLSQ